jgi:outer membrane immunogenic protein
MRTRHAAFLAVVASVACVQSASAADLGGPPRRAVYEGPSTYGPAFTWTGLYIGGHVGYGWSDADWQFEATPGISTSHSGDGGLAGGQIGYNIQMGHLVFGIEADMSGSLVEGGTACPAAGFNCEHSINWLASVRARAGMAINNNRTLLYATAGGAWADVDYSAANAVSSSTFSNTHSGWVAGGGIEHMLSQKFTARIEYLYYGFDSVTAPGGTLGGNSTSLDLAAQTVRFGLNFKF